jgi:hypothetical protein
MVSIQHIVAVAALGVFSIPALAGFNYFWRIDQFRWDHRARRLCTVFPDFCPAYPTVPAEHRRQDPAGFE